VRHADLRVLELAGAGTALQLQVHLVEHAQARRADRMTEALQAAVDLAGDLAGFDGGGERLERMTDELLIELHGPLPPMVRKKRPHPLPERAR